MANKLLEADSYRLFVPFLGESLNKSISVDENGDYIVQGLISSDAKDVEEDEITPEGMDCSYFLENGWIKYEHGNNPKQFIGEPLDVKVGTFKHPTLDKMVHGIYIKGRLYANRELTEEAVKTLSDLQKANANRRMGWSIEGSVVKRDRLTKKIVKSVLRNVVLTMNPVNTCTWAELSKSFATKAELEKAMDVAAAAPVTAQSIEGYKDEEDEQQKWINLFRSFTYRRNSSKSIGDDSYAFALSKGLSCSEAYTFANWATQRESILRLILDTGV